MAEQISILYLNPTKQLRAGIKALSQGLVNHTDVTVLTPLDSRSKINEHPNVKYDYFNARYVPGVRYTLPTISFLKKLNNHLANVDIVHTYSYFYPVCTLAALKSSYIGIPFVLTIDSLPGVNWSSGNRPVNLIARIYTETLGRLTFMASDRVITLGGYLTAPLSDYTNINKQLIIPNGINMERFSPSGMKYDKEQDKINLLFVGRLEPVKGIKYLLEAIATLNEDYHLTLVGDGTKRARYERLCSALSITDRVSFEGFQSNVVSYYQSHDLFILPSISEGQPTVLMEAQACGLPVISTDVGTASSLIGSGKTVPPKDTVRLAEAIKSFDFDSDPHGKSARSHVIDQYSEKTMCQRYFSVYKEMVEVD